LIYFIIILFYDLHFLPTLIHEASNKIPIKKAPKKKRPFFSIQEVELLLRIPNENRELGLRDKVLLSLMYASGARAQEICNLTVGKVHFNPNKTILDIEGKGRKVRRICIPNACAVILKQYLSYRNIHNKPERHIFSSQTHERMTVSCIQEIFKKYLSIAKKQNELLFREKSYSPHTMRHSTASHMLEAGIPLVVIKNFLGHESIQSTQIYAELSQNIVDKHLKEWNEKWFPDNTINEKTSTKKDNMPDFLK
jgi:integrase/recombinase XerD